MANKIELSVDTVKQLIANGDDDSAKMFVKLFSETEEFGGYENASLGRILDDFSYNYKKETRIFNGVSICELEEVGNCEGDGDYSSIVFGISGNGDAEYLGYFKITGYYSSYDGTTWDDEIKFVYPKQVVVTQYSTTKE